MYAWASERARGRAGVRHMGMCVRVTGGQVGRTAGLQEKLEIPRQFSEMDTPHATFKTFPIARAYVNPIYYPLPPIV